MGIFKANYNQLPDNYFHALVEIKSIEMKDSSFKEKCKQTVSDEFGKGYNFTILKSLQLKLLVDLNVSGIYLTMLC